MDEILEYLNINPIDYKGVVCKQEKEEVVILLINDKNERKVTTRIIDGKYITVINLSLDYSRIVNANPYFVCMIKEIINKGFVFIDTDKSLEQLLNTLSDYRNVNGDILIKDIAEKLFMFQGSIDKYNWLFKIEHMRDYYYFSLLHSLWVYIFYFSINEDLEDLMKRASKLKRADLRLEYVLEIIKAMNIDLPTINTIIKYKDGCNQIQTNFACEVELEMVMLEKMKNKTIELMINGDYSFKSLYYPLLDEMYDLYIQLHHNDYSVSYAYNLGKTSCDKNELIEILEEMYYLLLHSKRIDIHDHNLKLN